MKLPRKIKKKFEQIRGGGIAGFCYGVSDFDKARAKRINGRKKYLTLSCPFHSKDGVTCKLLNINTRKGEFEEGSLNIQALYACLTDQTAICSMENKKVRAYRY